MVITAKLPGMPVAYRGWIIPKIVPDTRDHDRFTKYTLSAIRVSFRDVEVRCPELRAVTARAA